MNEFVLFYAMFVTMWVGKKGVTFHKVHTKDQMTGASDEEEDLWCNENQGQFTCRFDDEKRHKTTKGDKKQDEKRFQFFKLLLF